MKNMVKIIQMLFAVIVCLACLAATVYCLTSLPSNEKPFAIFFLIAAGFAGAVVVQTED